MHIKFFQWPTYHYPLFTIHQTNHGKCADNFMALKWQLIKELTHHSAHKSRTEQLVAPPDMSRKSPKSKVIIILFYAKPWADLQCSWVWGHSSAHAPCRESAPRSRPQPAAPRCCSRLSLRASSSARTRTVYVPRDPEMREGLQSRNRQL